MQSFIAISNPGIVRNQFQKPLVSILIYCWPTVLLCDPPGNDHDENWRKSVSLREPDMFCVYPLVLLGDFGLNAPLQVAQTRGIGSYGFTVPVS